MNGGDERPRTPLCVGGFEGDICPPPRTPSFREGSEGDVCPPARFCKGANWKVFPRPVSIWCPPAHKAITIFRSDLDGLCFERRCCTARFHCATRDFFWTTRAGARNPQHHPEITLFTDRCLNHYTTASFQRISLK